MEDSKMKFAGCIAILIMALLLLPAHAGGNTLVIKSVQNGDTIEFEGGFTAHLTGIKVPSPNTQVGYKAFDFTKRAVEGKRVQVFTYTTDNTAAGIVYGKDSLPFVQIKYGEGYSTSLNELLLKKGYAKVNTKFLPEELEYFRDLESEAKRKGLGIWQRD
ncbi:hypothetical protein CEE37_13560 [candidate division LCP-89 bacterium B3_LCP]|uniref:TNase-like domain-containing protein n=1 Tax=candidate division LCP-89 bacterium B3_LCP TaxID=2012998 RepID=A0A532USR7_UNCL8|nr:MAG: hypothetical protein CEE37_13560 [candidate division LCP-89 bacterium B3_LCP]